MNRLRTAAAHLVAMLESSGYVIGKDCDDGYMAGYIAAPDPPDMEVVAGILERALVQAGFDLSCLIAAAEGASEERDAR